MQDLGLDDLPGELLQIIFRRIGKDGGTTKDLLDFSLASKRVFEAVWPASDSWGALLDLADYSHEIEVPGEGAFGFNLNRDGSVVACMSAVPNQSVGGVLHRFHLPSGEFDSLQVLEQLRIGRNLVEVSADGMTIVACNDFAVKLLVWNFEDSVVPLDIPQRCASIALSSVRKDILVCGFSLRSDGVRIYNLRSGTFTRELVLPGRALTELESTEYTEICLVEVTPDGQSVLEMRNEGSGPDDTTDFSLWDLESGELKYSWCRKGTRVWKPSFHCSGDYFCTVSYPNVDLSSSAVVEIWYLQGEETRVIYSWPILGPLTRAVMCQENEPTRIRVRAPRVATLASAYPTRIDLRDFRIDPTNKDELIPGESFLAEGPPKPDGGGRLVVTSSQCCVAEGNQLAGFSTFWPIPDEEPTVRICLKNLKYSCVG